MITARSANPPSDPQAYYLPRGNGRYEPTRATESPWDRRPNTADTACCASCPGHRPDGPRGDADRSHLPRLSPPAGEWVHLACRTHLTDDGVGLAHADMFDPAGFVGEVAQPLLVQRRKTDLR